MPAMASVLHEDTTTRREYEQQAAIDTEKEKSSGAQINVQEHVQEDDEILFDRQGHWRPGVVERFPWLGFSALLTVLLCIGFTAIILVTSNGKAKEEWPGA